LVGVTGEKMKMAWLTNHGNKTGKRGKFSNKAKKQTAKTCTVCQREGHIEEECWTKHPELRPTKGNYASKKSDA